MKLQTKITSMRKRRLGGKLILLTVLLALSLLCGTTSARTLLWSDDFDGTSIDTTKWTVIDAHDWENWQCWYAPHNVEVSGGTLKLHSQEESYNGRNWTGAKLESKYHPQYKYLEARVRHSEADTNVWSAWWTVGWNGVTWVWPPEFDIFEFVTAWGEYHPFQVYHWTDELRDGNPTDIDETQWHTYGVYWTATETPIFYVDGIISYVSSGPANVSAIAALMILSSSPSEYDHPNGCPLADFEVDYVRVYDEPPAQPVNEDNIALNKPASAFSVEGYYVADRAVDGYESTRWASEHKVDPQWLRVDLEGTYTIDKVKILWQYAYARDYKIQIAAGPDGPWTDCISISGNETYYDDDNVGDDWRTHEFLPQTGHYVRVYCTQREYGSQWGYSIFELEVYEREPECVGHWKFNENSISIAYDETSYNNDGDICGIAHLTYGIDDLALPFYGVDDYVKVPHSASLNLSNAITIEAWVKKNFFEGRDESIVSKKEAGAYYLGISGYHNTYPKKAVAEFRISGTYYSVVSPDDIPVNRWVHLAATFDGSNMKLYIDGELVNTTSCSGTIDLNTSNLFIGAESAGALPADGHGFNGTIDEVKIYNYALSDMQVLADYESLAPALVSHWSFDENIGSIAYDQTSNNNDGDIYDAAWETGGISNSALSFNGVNDYVMVPHSASLNLSNAITIEAWVKKDSFENRDESIVSKKEAGAYYLGISGYHNTYPKKVVAEFRISGTYYSVVSLNDLSLNEWVHLSATFDGSNMKLYVNGDLVDTTPCSGTIDLNNSNLFVGAESGGALPDNDHGFNGTIDEVKIYNYALSGKQVFAEYESMTMSLVSHWSFDNEFGGSIAYDETSNNNDGDIHGAIMAAFGYGNYGLYFGEEWQSYVEIPPSESLNITDEITVEAWVMPNSNSSSGQRSVVGKWIESSGNRCFGLWLDEAKPSFMVYDGVNSVTATFDTELTANNWYHLAGVFKPGEYVKIYVDGVAKTVPTTISSIQSAAAPVRIGKDDIGTYVFDFFEGIIDEVKVYNYAKTAEEIY